MNRIALFLRKWAARETGRDETALFGALPEPEILVTHDVDAIRKTPAIRLKQSAFQVFNSLRCATHMRLPRAARRLASAAQFLFSAADYWCFDELAEAEEALGLRSCFFVYGGDLRQRSPQQRLLDPGYDVGEPALKNKLCELAARGWQVGLHQSFNAWRDTELMSWEKSRVERTTISSSTPFLSGGKRSLKIRSACAEAGLAVECPCVVRFPGRNSADKATPSTIATSHAESVRHG